MIAILAISDDANRRDPLLAASEGNGFTHVREDLRCQVHARESFDEGGECLPVEREGRRLV